MEKPQEELKEEENTSRDENQHLRIGFEGCKRFACVAMRGQRAFQVIFKKQPEPRPSGRGARASIGEEQSRSDVAAEGGVVRPGRDEAGRARRPGWTWF